MLQQYEHAVSGPNCPEIKSICQLQSSTSKYRKQTPLQKKSSFCGVLHRAFARQTAELRGGEGAAMLIVSFYHPQPNLRQQFGCFFSCQSVAAFANILCLSLFSALFWSTSCGRIIGHELVQEHEPAWAEYVATMRAK